MEIHVKVFTRVAMLGVIVLVALLPALAQCTSDGNLRLLQEEVISALKSCITKNEAGRQRRSGNQYGYGDNPRIDGNTRIESNEYGHQRRNGSDMREQIDVLNSTDNYYKSYGAGSSDEKLVSVPRPGMSGSYNETNTNRTKRNEPLLDNSDADQCLSQCVFANLQVVDSRGIPREAEFWNKVQASVTSQQSRSALRDQIRACFQELQSEAEDNGCSYSNKLERCLMLRFADRAKNTTSHKETQGNAQKT